MSDLKKLDNAIAGIDDGLLADAMSSSETKQSGGRLRAVLGAVAAVAIIGGLAGLSMFLAKTAGPKQPASAPDITAAETENDTVKAADTTEVIAADTKNGDPTSFINLKVEHPSIKRIYTFEYIKDFLPEKIPENLTYGSNIRYVPGEYECGDGVYRPFKEKIFIHLRDKDTTVHDDGYIEAYEQGGYVELQILMSNVDFAPTEELSIDDIEKGFFQEGNDRYGMKNGACYSIAWNTTDGWQVVYNYKVYPADAYDSAYEDELFSLAASSQYFKDHFLK